MSIEIQITMPDWDSIELEIPCPRCKCHTWVNLGDIRLGGYRVCRGCHANIKLIDHLGQVGKIKSAFSKLTI